MEAMACGCPVASSNVTSLPELIGEAGLLFDPQDVGSMAAVMRRLRQDDDLCRRLSSMGKIRVQQFSAREYVHALMQVYEYAIAAYGRTEPSET
jgi:glycosyltransferase involved in cell wall biosynthesis